MVVLTVANLQFMKYVFYYICICYTYHVCSQAESAKRTSRVATLAASRRMHQGQRALIEIPRYVAKVDILLVYFKILGAGDLLCQIAKAGRSKTNVTRNLQTCILKRGVSLPIQLDLCRVRIRVRRPRVREVQVYWPCLSMKSWASVMLNTYPRFMLGGFDLTEESQWKTLFSGFWQTYREFDPNHDIYQHSDLDWSTVIPYLIHGDEGRGARQQPFMVESWQVLIPFTGPASTTVSGHSFCSRMLFTCVSSKLYSGENTLHDISVEWTRQMRGIFEEGVQDRGLL